MNIIPIQVTDEGVLIPKTYLRNASEVEVVASGDYFLIKPRQQAMSQAPAAPVAKEAPAPQQPAPPTRRNPLIASTRTRNLKEAEKAELLLQNEADRRNFTLRDGKPGTEFDLDS